MTTILTPADTLNAALAAHNGASAPAGAVLVSNGPGNAPSYQQIPLSSGVSGVLPVASGGTGLTSIGTGKQFLHVSIDGTSLEWVSLTTQNVGGLAAVATSGSYTDLSNTPTIPAAQVAADWNASTGAAQILNKPTLFSGSYTDLTSKPVLFSGSYTDLTSKPTLATVATSGSYNDLANKPTIPAAYTLPTASGSVLGGVMVGSGLSISSGVLSVNFPAAVSTFNGRSGAVTLTGSDISGVGKINVTDPSSSTSPTTGALTVAGGLGVGGALFVNTGITTGYAAFSGTVSCQQTTGTGLWVNSSQASTSTASGAAVVLGGMGVVGDVNIGGTVNAYKVVAGSPIVVSSGGTGLTSVGTAGQVLSSDGTNMVWTTPSGGSGGTSYTLPTASASVLGGIKVGSGLAIDANGVLSASGGGSGGSGTVTSVAVTSSTLTVTGSPITASGTIDIELGTVGVANGGTGLTSYTTGQLIYASAAGTLAGLSDVATGNVLISGGTSAAPSYGKVGLTTHVSGTLPVASGGTGQTGWTTGALIVGGTTLNQVAGVATGSVLLSAGTNTAPTWGKVALASAVSGTLPLANGGTATATAPTTGQVLQATSTTAAAWTSQPYDIGLYIEGVTTASEVVFRFAASRAFTWPASLTNSKALASTAATASTTFTITRNGTSVGSFVFAASGTTATFTFSSAITFAVGDVIQITAPATPDSTLANIAITFAGTR